MTENSPTLPPGSDEIARLAASRGLAYQPTPLLAWFISWEPYDTMTSAEAYYNGVSWPTAAGGITVAEPWLAPLDSEPLGRTLLVFVTDPRFRHRASARHGEHFNTRVAYFENAPPPTVELGDPKWDEWMVTLSASASEAAAAFPPPVRQLLRQWGFTGHVEVRPGGLVVNFADLRPAAADLERVFHHLPKLLGAFFPG